MWEYELYINEKDLGEFSMRTYDLEAVYEFKEECPK